MTVTEMTIEMTVEMTVETTVGRITARNCLAAALALLALAARSPAGETPSPADDAYQAAANLFAAGRHAEAADAYAAFAGSHPGDGRVAEARFMAGEARFRAGDLPGSIEALAPLRADARAAFREANALYLLGRAEEASARLRELVSREGLPAPIAGPARYFLARSLLNLGRPDEARDALSAAPKPVPAPQGAYLAAALGDVEAAGFLAPKEQGGGDPKRLEAALAAYREALGAGGALVPDVLFKTAELLRRGGRAAEAVPHYRRAADEFASSPVAPFARLGLAWAALGAGDPATAAREAARVREGAAGEALAAEARFAEGTALLAAKRYADAAGVLEPLLLARGGPVPRDGVLRRLAWAALAAGQGDLAGRAAADLVALDLAPARAAEARYLAGERELSSGRPEEALAHFDAATGGGAELDALVSYRRAAALDAKGDPGAAAAAFAAFRKAHPDHPLAPWAAALAGRAFLAGGRSDDAVESFKEARELFAGRPEEPEILWGATVAEYRRGSFVSMAGFARRILEGHAASPRAADAAYWLGWWHLERKEFERAAQRFGDAAGLARKAGRMKLAGLATLEAASALGDAGDAAGALRTAKDLVTGDLAAHAPAEAVLWVAETLRGEGRTDDARQILDQSLARAGGGPERARLLYALGEIARQEGRTDAALDLFEKAVAAEPPPELRAAALLGKARCLVAKGRRREVEVILQNVIDRTAGWARAAAHVELGKLALEEAAGLEGPDRAALAERAAREFMLVAVLYVPEGRGEGAQLSREALLGAARAYALLGRHATARARLEQFLAEPLYRTGPDGKETPEAVEARRLLEEVGLKASGARDGAARARPEDEKPAMEQGGAP